MPSPKPKAATVGRRQGDRPGSGDAPKAAHGPRMLHGALTLPIEQIVPDPDQPRKDVDANGLKELAASLKEYGVLQPLLVREDGLLDDHRTKYTIVAGGRRYEASRLAGLTHLPVVVHETAGASLRLTQLVENIQRQDLTPLEEARAFQELLDAAGDLDAEKLGTRLGISGQKVRDRLLLLTDQVVSDAVQREQMPVTVAVEALRLPEEGQRRVRADVATGKSIDRAAVRELRDELKAAGVANPRTKGGGKPRKTPAAAPSPKQSAVADQCRIDPVTADGRIDGLEQALEGLPRPALTRALAYGVARQWTCQQLLEAIPFK